MILSVEESTSNRMVSLIPQLLVTMKSLQNLTVLMCKSFLVLSFSTEYPIPREINPLVQHDQCGQADISGDPGNEWLMDLSLEDLQDYSLEDVGGCGGGDSGDGDGSDSGGGDGGDSGGGDGGDSGGGDGGNWDSGDCDGDGGDGLDDEAILDRVANEMDLNIPDSSRIWDASAHGATPASTLSNTHSECNNDIDMDINSQCEDSLFDRAYDLYESKIT